LKSSAGGKRRRSDQAPNTLAPWRSSRVQEAARADDPDVAESRELQEVLVACPNRIGARGEGAFEDSIIRLILAYDVYRLARVD